jgi:cyanate lyase
VPATSNRFCELVLVNGPAGKAPIEGAFGDGIMPAVDFDTIGAPVAPPSQASASRRSGTAGARPISA